MTKYFSLVAIFVFSVSTQAIRAQCPLGLIPGTNELVVNGDFSAGNTSFTSNYAFCNTSNCLQPEATYTVAADPNFYHTSFFGSDHTTGTGNFLIVNGSPNGADNVWCQTIPVEQNKFYVLSFWLSTMVAQSPAQIRVTVNNINFFLPMDAPSNTFEWIQFANTWNSGTNTTADVCILNNNTSLGGNDFGIDDISFVKCECDIPLDAGAGGSICAGDSIHLDGSGAIGYFWFPPAGLSCTGCEDPWAAPAQSTLYYVSVNGAGGCVALDSVFVNVFPETDLNAQPIDTSVCPGSLVQLDAVNAVQYHWTPQGSLSNPNISNPVATVDASTTYFVSATDANGCAAFDSVVINVVSTIAPVAFPDTTICSGDEVQLHVSHGDSFSWSPSSGLSCDDCQDPLASPQATTTYLVTVVDTSGCPGGDASVTVSVNPFCVFVELPNAFSPNGDGSNDSFNVLGSGITSFQLDVYNRWGQLIFSTSDLSRGWDGKFQDELQPVGVYVWHLIATLADGSAKEQSGNVTLVR